MKLNSKVLAVEEEKLTEVNEAEANCRGPGIPHHDRSPPELQVSDISVQDEVDPSPLFELFRPFTNVEELFFLPQHVSSHVMYILEQEGIRVLPNARVTRGESWPPRKRTLPLHRAPWLARGPISADKLHVVWDVSKPPSSAMGISGKDVLVDLSKIFSSNVTAVFPETDEIVVVFNTALAQDLMQPIDKRHKVSRPYGSRSHKRSIRM
ncbi:hypothetical protein BGW80DRAFT_1527802 [Lactifluus volemus]|nr:hypothetical protein BGW80DRAFT_1527802 [Lactifluus volemus]